MNDPLVNPSGLPILLAHLQRPYPDAIRDGLARAIAVPQAKFAWPVLLKLYLHEPKSRTKNGLAVALAKVADDELIDHIIALAKDANHRESRGLLLDAIGRSDLPQARAALAELASDGTLRKEVLAITRQKRTGK